jgi:hypothetical protein
MLASVDLNDKLSAKPSEVDDVAPDRRLATKRNALLAEQPQQSP